MQDGKRTTGSDQPLVTEWATQMQGERSPTGCNLVAVGGELKMREDGDGVLCVGYQNIRRSEMSRGLELAPELTAMCDIGADIQGISEINRPWTTGNKALYRL